MIPEYMHAPIGLGLWTHDIHGPGQLVHAYIPVSSHIYIVCLYPEKVSKGLDFTSPNLLSCVSVFTQENLTYQKSITRQYTPKSKDDLEDV